MTDRLHAHILALLLGIPHVVLDTRFGKVSGFVETWTTDEPTWVRRAGSLEEAASLAIYSLMPEPAGGPAGRKGTMTTTHPGHSSKELGMVVVIRENICPPSQDIETTARSASVQLDTPGTKAPHVWD